MSSTQTAINVFENKLASVDDELASTDDKRLINEDFDGLHQNPARFAKSWPFCALKIQNLIVLLLLAISGCVGASYGVHWDGYDWPDRPMTFYGSKPDEVAAALVILFGIALFSVLANWFLRKNAKNSTFWASYVTLMDLSLSVLTAVTLLFPTVIFTVISISEHRWFWPKFVQFGGNGTEALFKQIFDSYRVAFEAISSHRRGYYYSSYYNDWSSYREFSIKVHLITDPLNAIFSMLAILLNVLIAVCLIKMMRRWNLWAPKSEDYKSRHPNCTELEQKYSKHWLLKDIQWFFPAIVFFAFLCFNLTFYVTKALTMVGLGLMAILFLLQSVLYCCKVRLRKEENANGLMSPFVMDCAVCLCAIFYFFITWDSGSMYGPQLIAYMIGTLFYGYSLARNAWYFWKHGNWGKLKLNLPNISIQINFNVEVKPKNEKENNGKVEKLPEEEKKEKKDTVGSEQNDGKQKQMEV